MILGPLLFFPKNQAASPPVGTGLWPMCATTDTFLPATSNSWINLKMDKPSNPNPDVLVSKALSVGYSSEAECPNFLRFLNDLFEDDLELIGFVQRALTR